MSAKRARKPFKEVNLNRIDQGPLAKRRKVHNSSQLSQPESFVPMDIIEHDSESQAPEDTELTPVGFFELFWDDTIIEKLVLATNEYARSKGAYGLGQRSKWQRPLTPAEFRVFLGVTIMMGVVRVPSVRRYWAYGLLAKNSISCMRYYQIRRFLHISMPQNTPLCYRDWWKKLEPLSSHLRQRSQKLYTPGTHVSVDEMMIPFTGRSRHTVRIPSKPIPVGYKMLALCDSGYTVNWLFTSRTESIAELVRIPDLSPTSSAVIQLCACLDTKLSYIVYTDNGFSSIPLFRRLRELGIAACGTTRINSAEYPEDLKFDKSLTEWNTMDGLVVGDPGVLCLRWIDNNIVRMLSTVHPWGETTRSERRKPRATSTNATIVRKAFGGQERKSFFIPTVIDDYNHHMNGVDLADQRRAAFNTHQQARRNWLPFFFAFLDISVTNTFLLFDKMRVQKLNNLLDSGELTPERLLQHPMSKAYPAELFRRVLYKQLCTSKGNTKPRVYKAKSLSTYRVRLLPVHARKTQRIYFTKHTDFNLIHQSTFNIGPNHILERISKRRECVICRFDFRTRQNTSTISRRRPKLTQYQCSTCNPPIALCGPAGQTQCFQRWHSHTTP